MSSSPTTTERMLQSGATTQPTMALLHGLGMAAWMWRPQLTLLGEQYHTLAPDLPGFGAAAASGPFSMRKAAQAVIELVRANGGPAHICGLSMGAMVALQVYHDAPELVASLILSGGQVHPGGLATRVRRLVVSLAPERMLTDDLPKEVTQLHPELVAEATAAAHQMSKRNVLSALDAISAVDFRPLLPTISAPTLVLCGANDAAHLPAARQMVATIPDAELRIIPDAGHVWNLEQPDLFAQTALAFAQRVDGQREAAPGQGDVSRQVRHVAADTL